MSIELQFIDKELQSLHKRLTMAKKMLYNRERWLWVLQEELLDIGVGLAPGNIYMSSVQSAYEEVEQAKRLVSVLESQETGLLMKRNDLRYDC
jgi:hypothetical protein